MRLHMSSARIAAILSRRRWVNKTPFAFSAEIHELYPWKTAMCIYRSLSNTITSGEWYGDLQCFRDFLTNNCRIYVVFMKYCVTLLRWCIAGLKYRQMAGYILHVFGGISNYFWSNLRPSWFQIKWTTWVWKCKIQMYEKIYSNGMVVTLRAWWAWLDALKAVQCLQGW